MVDLILEVVSFVFLIVMTVITAVLIVGWVMFLFWLAGLGLEALTECLEFIYNLLASIPLGQ